MYVNPVILVTGTSRGLGSSIAHLLLTTTPPLSLITVSRSPSPSGTIALPNGAVHSHTHIQLDLSVPGVPAKAIREAVGVYGRLDGVVINHGVLDPVERVAGEGEGGDGGEKEGKGKEVGDGLEEWRRAWEVNFFSVVGLCRSAIPHLRTTSGRLIFISSGASQTGYAGWGCYSASKAALNSLCRTISIEEPLITSICVRPGVIDTEMQRDVREKHAKAMGEGHGKFVELYKSGRLLRPEMPGAVVANLVLRGGRELSGRYFSWDEPELKDYQGVVVPAP